MIRSLLLFTTLILLGILVLNACSSSSNPNPGTRGGPKADLVITAAEISLGEVCQAGSPILMVRVEVKNQGDAASPARNDVGLVGTSEVTTNWGNGVGLPKLEPNQSTAVEIPVYYLIADPSFMQGNHSFEVFVNSGGWIDESNTSNNKFSPNLNINVPANFCKFPVQGRSWGDPHIITFDGLKYEFQTVGEFWLVRTPQEDFAVQVCQQPWFNSQRVSVNTAVAALLSEHRVNVYLNTKESPIRVDGGELNIEDGSSVEVSEGNSISRKGNDYTLLSASGDRVVIELRGSYLNISVHTARFEGITGLLGNANSSTEDDMALSNGEVLSQPMSLATRYGDFANSWRITSGSLFVQDNFECPSNEDFPVGKDVTLDELDNAARQKAETACAEIKDKTLLEACIIDVALTDDTSFAEASANAPVPNTALELAKPDLIVTEASVSLGSCKQDGPFLNFSATVKNIGNAASPTRHDVGIVGAIDADTPQGQAPWGNGVGLDALAPNQSTVVQIPVHYLIDDPTYMIGAHRFEVNVNRGDWIEESDTSNNSFGILNITIPADFCPSLSRRGRSWGDPHLVTLDGLAYEFQTVGTFTLAKKANSSQTVEVCQQPWGNSNRLSVNVGVATLIGTKRLRFDLEKKAAILDGTELNLANGASTKVGDGNLSRMANNIYKLEYPNGDVLKVTLYAKYLDVDFWTIPNGKMQGLLGNANTNLADDIALSNGTVLSQPVAFADIYGSYASSWRTGAQSLFAADNFSCNADTNFPEKATTPNDFDEDKRRQAEEVCDQAGVTNAQLLQACIIDVAGTGDNDFAKSSAESDAPERPLTLRFPDLKVILPEGLSEFHPDQDIGEFSVQGQNVGDATAPGTLSAGATGGYMVDIVLSQGNEIIDANDILLTGGRISNTPDLVASAERVLSEGNMTIPPSTPLGNYNLCAFIDSQEKVVESDEGNNVTCVAVKIVSPN